MTKIFKFFKNSKAMVFAIVLLLIGQAFCDLALPQYTSNIVDIGIQQKGIENAVPKEVSEQTLKALCLFLTEEEAAQVKGAYTMNTTSGEEDRLTLHTKDKKEIETLNNLLGVPMVMISMIEKGMPEGKLGNGQMAQGQKMTKEQLLQLVDGGFLTKEQLLAMKEQVQSQLGQLSGSIIKQKAILGVSEEYEQLGIDMGKLQTNYLLKTGGKMLGLSILMMITSILTGLLAARTAAKIGRDLRSDVFKKVVSFSNNEMDKFSTASLITRSTNDIQQIQMVSVMLLRMVAYAPILGIGGIIKVASTKTGMGWIIGVGVGAILAVVTILMFIAMPKFKMMQTLVDRLNLVSREILTGIPVIRAFSRERFEEQRFDGANKDLMRTQLFTNRVMTFMMPLMMLLMNGLSVLIVWVGAHGIDAGNLQVGDMMAFITYTMQIVMSFLMLSMISIMLPRAGVAADRICEVLNTEVSIL